jgi:hypothetical protein
MPLLPVKAMPALQSTKPGTCALLKCTFQVKNWQTNENYDTIPQKIGQYDI